MAEEHEGGGGGTIKDAGDRIIGLLVFLFFISLIVYHFAGTTEFSGIWENLKDWYYTFTHESAFGRFIASLVFGVKFIGTYLSLIFIIAIVYLEMRLHAVHHEEHHMYMSHDQDHGHASHSEEEPQKKKWQRVEEHLQSENPSDWRLAILEADIMLEDMMEHKGVLGETIGDKLKNTSKNEFPGLDKAWEAHKIRNLIVHEGSNFLISKREAQRVVGLYREIFQDSSYI